MNHKHFRLSEANPDGGAGGGNPEDKNDPNKAKGGEPDGGEGDPPKSVSYETHRRLLGEKKAEQEKRQKLEADLKALNDEKAANQKAELEKQGNYKALLEAREKELTEEKAKNAAIVGEITDARKKRAILKHIDGKVPEGALQLLPLSMVELDADGKPTEQTAKAAAQLFQKEHSYAIQKDKEGGGGLPNEAAGGGGKKGAKISYETWKALSATEMKKQYGNVDWSTAPQT